MSRLPEQSSLSNCREIAVTHNDIELDVSFETKIISGFVLVSVKALVAGVQQLDLDTSGIAIAAVSLHSAAGEAAPLEYELAPPHKVMGSKLSIKLPTPLALDQTAQIGIRFATSPEATALQWLEPSQTADKAEPYLFTQCQAIHARSFIPCQDTPSVKSTYSAAVRAPAQLTSLMSAVLEAGVGAGGLTHLPAPAAGAVASKVQRFRQGIPIPSYLLALAVGKLESRRIGPISHVWSEPSVVDAAAYEFENTAKYLTTAEEIAGDYVWGVYDLLVLPPSFPYGGMENPCLTFVTPTLLAGDRSLDRVICHEIAHSWTGNLVSCSTWEHFWLNEGCTMFLERKVVGRLDGDKAFQFGAAQGYQALADAVRELGADSPFTCLVPDLSGGVDPDDSFSRIPYEKGFYFLYYLQTTAGGAEAFEPFFKRYIQHFRLRNASSEDFKALYMEHFTGVEAVKAIDWDHWFYSTGMPPAVNKYDTSMGDAALALAAAWHGSDIMGIGTAGPPAAAASDLDGWESEQVVLFLDKLVEYRSLQAMSPKTTRRMDQLYSFDASHNAEVRSSWYRLCLAAGDETIYPLVVAFLKEQGRMKYVRPLYKALFRSTAAGKKLALRTFQESKAALHPIAAKMVAVDLGIAAVQ